MVIDIIKKMTLTIRNTMLIYHNHSIATSTISVVIFTAACYFIVTSYLSSFGLDFFIFGGMPDIYQMALHQGLIIKLFLVSQLLLVIPIVIYSLVITVIEHGLFTDKSHDLSSNRTGNINQDQQNKLLLNNIGVSNAWPLLILTSIIIWLLGSPILISFLSKDDAKIVKSGFSARYNIKIGKETIPCLSIIGSTSSYIFTWNNKDMTASALPKSEIKMLTLIIPPPPSNRPPYWAGNNKIPISVSIKDYEFRAENIKKSQAQWSFRLEKICQQSVQWLKW